MRCPTDPVVIAAKVTPAIAETVKKQVEAGIDCIGDGEFWTARNLAHYAAHFTGVEARPVARILAFASLVGSAGKASSSDISRTRRPASSISCSLRRSCGRRAKPTKA
jgi:methionine synthase II (cobalamin-independent)